MAVNRLLESSSLDEEWAHLQVNKLSVRSVDEKALIQAKLWKVDANTASLSQHPTYTVISTNATNYEGDAKHFEQQADGIKVLVDGDYKVEIYARGPLTQAADSLYCTYLKNASTAQTADARIFIQSTVGASTNVSVLNGGETVGVLAGTTVKVGMSTSASPSGAFNSAWWELKLTKLG